jgi:Glycosyltransferase like family
MRHPGFQPPKQNQRVERFAESAARFPLSFVVCVSDPAILGANLRASPCLSSGPPHEVISVRNAPNAAAGLNLGLERAKNEWVVCVHQDVYLPRGWDWRLADQLDEAERRFGPIGVAGVYGVGEAIERSRCPLSAERIGRVVERRRVLRDGSALPARVATLDELLLVVRRDARLRFDPALGFHLYGADICLQARELGLAVVALNALCTHNSRNAGLTQVFLTSARVFARKWAHRLPIATPCVVLDREGQVFLLGNAPVAGPALAQAAGRPLDHDLAFNPSPEIESVVSRP